MNTSTRRILKVWLPSVVWVAVITVESTNLGSAERTARLLYPIFSFLFGLDHAHFAVWHSLVRKTGHFVGYFTLSVLFFRSWRATFPRLSTRWCLPWAALAFLSTAMIASLDEWHQSFLPSRTGTLRDVVLDTSAAMVAQLLLFTTMKFRNRASQVSMQSKP